MRQGRRLADGLRKTSADVPAVADGGGMTKPASGDPERCTRLRAEAARAFTTDIADRPGAVRRRRAATPPSADRRLAQAET
ncbi:hypothetical protein [Streptomyces sp. NPDC085466]|uniref:hypothetical protein n=1 Tax=Streptomyces sp. NPDC085466 TaxID=3365725 RepID=UPI0037D38286